MKLLRIAKWQIYQSHVQNDGRLLPLLHLEEVLLAQRDGGLGNVVAPCCPYVIIGPMLEFVAQITALLQR